MSKYMCTLIVALILPGIERPKEPACITHDVKKPAADSINLRIWEMKAHELATGNDFSI